MAAVLSRTSLATYQGHRVSNSRILTHNGTVHVLAETGRVVVDIRDANADRGHSTKGRGAPIFGFHHQIELLACFIV